MGILPSFSKKSKEAAPASGEQKNAEVQLILPDAYQTVLSHYPVYRNAYRSLLRTSIILGCLQCVAIGAVLFIVVSAKPEDRFFTSSVIGRNTQIFPADTAFDEPTINQIVRSTIDAMNFGYLSYSARFAETRDPFAEGNFDKLVGTIMGEGGIEAMVASETSYDAVYDPSRPFQVIHAGVASDLVYESTYDIPIVVTVKKGITTTAISQTPWLVRVHVRRSMNLSSAVPFAITDIVASPVAAPQPVSAPAAGATP